MVFFCYYFTTKYVLNTKYVQPLNDTRVTSVSPGFCSAMPQRESSVSLLALCQQHHVISPNSLTLLLAEKLFVLQRWEKKHKNKG